MSGLGITPLVPRNREEEVMSAFKPYHEGLPAYVDLLDPYDDGYLIRLVVLADLARTLKVPKEHRAAVAATFKKQANELQEAGHWPEQDAADAIDACQKVGFVMGEQDEEDAAKEQQVQQ